MEFDKNDTITIKQPLLIVYEEDNGNTATILHPTEEITPAHYGLLLADCLRHVARMYDCSEDKVWKYLKKEYNNPTSSIWRE